MMQGYFGDKGELFFEGTLYYLNSAKDLLQSERV